MVKRATHVDGAAGTAFVPDPTGVRAGLPKSKDGAEGDIPQGSSGLATPGQTAKNKKASNRSGMGSGSAGGDSSAPAQGSSKLSHPGQSMKLTAEDLDITDDVEAIFEGSDFSDEFKDKAQSILETALVAKVNEQLDILSEEMEQELDEARAQVAEELSEQLDKYLNYVVEQWMENNQLAVETGIKSEMTESFLSGLKELMQEHYVDIPEEESDVLEELAQRVSELEDSLNEEIDRNTELSAILNDFAKSEVFAEISEGLTETQTAKLESLSEAIAAEDIDDFAEKLANIRESYFSTPSAGAGNRFETAQFDEDEVVDLNEDGNVRSADPQVNKYAQYLSRTVKK